MNRSAYPQHRLQIYVVGFLDKLVEQRVVIPAIVDNQKHIDLLLTE